METSCESIVPKISADSDPAILTEGSYANISSKFLENGNTNKLEKMDDDENDNVVDINGKMGLDNFVVDSVDYRVDSDASEDLSSDSDSIDSSSSCSSLSSEDEEIKEETSVTKAIIPRTKGELCLEDLPKVEELNISVPECELKALGKIFNTVQEILVVASFKNSPALNMDSILFLSNGNAIGSVFETWGPVVEPFYSIRFNSAGELEEKAFIMGDTVYYAPRNKGVTSYVLVEVLQTEKGSDASWADNNEPPVECLDYSDDEQEREARLKRRAKNRSVSVVEEIIPKKVSAIEAESPKATVENVVSSQGQTFNSFQQSTYLNTVTQFSRGFIRTVHPRSVVPTNFIVRPNPLFRPGHLPIMSPRPLFLQSPRFPMPRYAAPNGWTTQQAAATFQTLNQQRMAMPNIQNESVNSGQSFIDGSSQSNPVRLPERNLNSTSSSVSTCDTSPTVCNESNKGMQFRPNNPPLAPNMSPYHPAVMAGRTPVLFNPRGFATSFPINPVTMTPIYHLPPPATVNRPILNSQNYERTPLRVSTGPTFNAINGTSLRQPNSNVHTMSISPSSVSLTQHLQLNSPSPRNLSQGSEYPPSKEMIQPPTPPATSFASVGLSPSIPQYHLLRASTPTSITSNSHVLQMPNISSCHTQNQPPPFVSTAVPTLRTWHPIQRPVFGMLPNVFGQNMMFGMPVRNSIPSAGVIAPTNMAASLRPGIAHAKPRVLLQPSNVIPPFDPRVPPPSCDST